MILYLDSSAAVKLYVAEEHDGFVHALVAKMGREYSGAVVVSSIAYVEIVAALAAKARAGKISREGFDEAVRLLRMDLRTLFAVRAIDGRVLGRAAELPAPAPDMPGRHKLKGYDAVQLATVLLLREDRARTAAQQTAEIHARRERERQTLSPELLERLHAEPVVEIQPEEVLMLAFDKNLHDAAVREGIAHEQPGRRGGKRFDS